MKCHRQRHTCEGENPGRAKVDAVTRPERSLRDDIGHAYEASHIILPGMAPIPRVLSIVRAIRDVDRSVLV